MLEREERLAQQLAQQQAVKTPSPTTSDRSEPKVTTKEAGVNTEHMTAEQIDELREAQSEIDERARELRRRELRLAKRERAVERREKKNKQTRAELLRTLEKVAHKSEQLKEAEDALQEQRVSDNVKKHRYGTSHIEQLRRYRRVLLRLDDLCDESTVDSRDSTDITAVREKLLRQFVDAHLNVLHEGNEGEVDMRTALRRTESTLNERDWQKETR
ncbi:MAG: hypothetical protein MHM6MM_005893 [Cercozoa sp. M6MM]